MSVIFVCYIMMGQMSCSHHKYHLLYLFHPYSTCSIHVMLRHVRDFSQQYVNVFISITVNIVLLMSHNIS